LVKKQEITSFERNIYRQSFNSSNIHPASLLYF